MKFWIWLLVVCGLIGGVWGVSRSMRVEARQEAAAVEHGPWEKYAAAQAAAPAPAGLTPYDGPYDPIEPKAPRIVDRAITGGCPAGYVDHPADPKQCVLPYVAERMLHPRR